MNPKEILSLHQLKCTSCREGILSAIMSVDHALSEDEIKNYFAGNYDRTTFYRSFKTLEENNVIHRVVVDNNVVKYAFDKSMAGTHPHFYCVECNSVQCLDGVDIVQSELPAGFVSLKTDVLIKGTCDKCNTKSNPVTT